MLTNLLSGTVTTENLLHNAQDQQQVLRVQQKHRYARPLNLDVSR
jgi:hypothetical protein